MLVIPCSEGGARLELLPDGGDHWLARFDSAPLAAVRRVFAYRGEGLAEFFASLARDWRGWPGERTWSSLERELSLRVHMDRLGHATFRIAMRVDDVGRWTMEAHVVVGAGELDGLARQARALVEGL